MKVKNQVSKERFRNSRAEYQNKLVANQQLGACLFMMQRRERSVNSRAKRQKDRDDG